MIDLSTRLRELNARNTQALQTLATALRSDPRDPIQALRGWVRRPAGPKAGGPLAGCRIGSVDGGCRFGSVDGGRRIGSVDGGRQG